MVRSIGNLVFLLILTILSVLALHPQCLAQEKEPVVTRWMHPLGIPKPDHIPPPANVPLVMQKVSAKEAVVDALESQDRGRVCIVVHQNILTGISAGLDKYESDLVLMGFSTIRYVYTSGSGDMLREALLTLYEENDSLAGAVFVGDIPYVIYEMMQDWGDGEGYEDFPCDIFFMDLNGTWADSLEYKDVHAANGKYDTRSGNLDIEIWVCRLKADNLPGLGSETDILKSYFDKDHRYRRGRLTPAGKALVYNDDDWSWMAVQDQEDIQRIYAHEDIAVVSNPETTTARDYKNNHMSTDYELMFIRSHGYPGGHGFYQNNRTAFEFVFKNDYLAYDPAALFYSMFICSAADYTMNDYLAGSVALNPEDSGLLVWSSTKSGGMWAQSEFFEAMEEGKVFGEAFRRWFNYVQFAYPTYAPRWWYGMVLVGDAALTRVTTAITPLPDLKANGNDAPVDLTFGDTLSVTIELDPGSYPGVQADWWCVANTPFGWYHYNYNAKKWQTGFQVSYQGSLKEISPSFEVLNRSDLPIGSYNFYFGVDGNKNGNLDEPLFYDNVTINIKTP